EPPSATVNDAAVITGAASLVNVKMRGDALSGWLATSPLSAVIENVGVRSLPSSTNRTSPALSCALVNTVAVDQMLPLLVSKWPWLALVTVNVNAVASGSVMLKSDADRTVGTPSLTANDAFVTTGAASLVNV